MSQEKDNNLDKVFVLEKVFPDVEVLFDADFRTLADCSDKAIFVLDTNILLRPYELQKETIDEIETVYKRLISESRLFIPNRVFREFYKNRAKKISEIHSKILDLKSKNMETKLDINSPILELLKEKKELDEIIVEIKQRSKEIISKIDSLAECIENWGWRDPVSTLYKAIFHKGMLIDTKLKNEKIAAELSRRRTHKIPPGYKDEKKEDGGVGDLIIWLSILELGQEKEKDIIFVTEDMKSDWWQKTNGPVFLPRFELVDEFRRKSSGKTLHIIKFPKFLELGNASSAAVEDSKQVEKKISNDYRKMVHQVSSGRWKIVKGHNLPGREEAIDKIKRWFFRNFENPVDCCPHETKEGGYLYIFGGPYDAREEIESEFGGIIDKEIIDEVVSELEEECFEWSRNSRYEYEE